MFASVDTSLDSPLFDAQNYFATDFYVCRSDFLHQASLIKHLECELVLPQQVAYLDETPQTDCLWLGSKNAERVLVLISGTHGVEGFCGSAAQKFVLSEIARLYLSLPESFAVLMVHALNPWGMAWARRCDQDGVDLNRNFVDFSRLSDRSRDYELLARCLIERDKEKRLEQFQQLQKQWGMKHYDKVVSGGQYHLPWAPFYGGIKPSSSNMLIEQLISLTDLADRELVVIDIHSGLGPFAHGELISDHPLNTKGNEYARDIFGGAIASTAEGASFSVPKEGLLDYRWHRMMQKRGCFLTLEFGSYGSDALFDVILDDHLAWRQWQETYGKAESFPQKEYQKNRAAMVNHFCPPERLWRESVLFKKAQLFNQVLWYFQ